jgi:hypothetical protein
MGGVFIIFVARFESDQFIVRLFACQMELSLDGVVRSSCFRLPPTHLVHAHRDFIQLAEFVGIHRDKLILLIDPEQTAG